MQKVKKILRRLFFYSSRQLLRRKRSYVTIFITSVVLLSLVMTFLEMAESYYLKDIESSRSGTHHASIKSMREDYTDDFLTHSRVDSVFTIPYTSLMASSDDASKPAKITVENSAIDDYLNIRYLWGSQPADGEIAVSSDLYKAYGYLSAGEENELFFTASEMTYFPLRISGIFECSDRDAGYAFVSANTQKQIDAETGAITKYDHYIRCKNSSDRYIAMVVEDLFEWYKLYDTDEQERQPKPERRTASGTAIAVYEPYINTEYLEYALTQQAAPVITYSMPVIIIAALMMASFMTNWITANAAEYGILGAIGANRRQLCAISAGQILLIGLLASFPVILFSSLISNIYISTYNAASASDVDFIYSVPWGNLIEAALWWNVLACFFTYIGIAKLTREEPYVLISGSFRSRMPFVKHSDYKLSRKKDKIRRLAFVRSLRQVKSGIVTAVITSMICIVCGLFVFLLIANGGNASAVLSRLKTYASDMLISVTSSQTTLYNNRNTWITEEDMLELEQIDGVAKVGRYRYLEQEFQRYALADKNGVLVTHSVGDVRGSSENDVYYRSAAVVNEASLDLMTENVVDGNPGDLFTKEKQVVLTNTEYGGKKYAVGDKIVLTGAQEIKFNKDGNRQKITLLTEEEFTIAAIILANEDYGEFRGKAGFVLTSEGAALLDTCEYGTYDRAMVWFDEGLTEAEMVAISEQIAATPAFMRFDLLNISMKTDSEKQINTAITVMLCFFFSMLYLSLVTMMFVDSTLKVTKMRSEIAVLRQVGAQDSAIYKTLRTETYLVSAIGLALSVTLIVIAAYGYLSMQTGYLYQYADRFPDLYPPELIAKIKREYQMQALMMLSILLPVIPMHALSSGVSVLGTIPPLRRVLNETITEGLRKDTD